MTTVANYRAARKLKQELGKFHIAHFPVGTVVEVELPTNGFIANVADRIHPEEVYGRSTKTVVGVHTNGPDSFILEFAGLCNLGTGWLDSTNMDWVRKIVKRGDGTLTVEQQALVDAVAADKKKYTQLMEVEFLPSSKGTYHVLYRGALIDHYLKFHPKYQGVNTGNLIDRSKLEAQLDRTLGNAWTHTTTGVKINKKQFAKAFETAYRKANTNRAKAQWADIELQNKMMEDDYEAYEPYDASGF